MKKITKIIAASLLSVTPLISFAAEKKDLKYIADLIIEYLNIGLGLIIALAVITFVWNVFQYFFTEKTDNKAEAGMYVLYSVIGFFVILSFWGLVAILRNTLNLDDRRPDTPFAGLNLFNNSNTPPTPNTGPKVQ